MVRYDTRMKGKEIEKAFKAYKKGDVLYQHKLTMYMNAFPQFVYNPSKLQNQEETNDASTILAFPSNSQSSKSPYMAQQEEPSNIRRGHEEQIVQEVVNITQVHKYSQEFQKKIITKTQLPSQFQILE